MCLCLQFDYYQFIIVNFVKLYHILVYLALIGSSCDSVTDVMSQYKVHACSLYCRESRTEVR